MPGLEHGTLNLDELSSRRQAFLDHVRSLAGILAATPDGRRPADRARAVRRGAGPAVLGAAVRAFLLSDEMPPTPRLRLRERAQQIKNQGALIMSCLLTSEHIGQPRWILRLGHSPNAQLFAVMDNSNSLSDFLAGTLSRIRPDALAPSPAVPAAAGPQHIHIQVGSYTAT